MNYTFNSKDYYDIETCILNADYFFFCSQQNNNTKTHFFYKKNRDDLRVLLKFINTNTIVLSIQKRDGSYWRNANDSVLEKAIELI